MMMLTAGFMAIYFVLNLCIINFRGMREFMADPHAAKRASDGAKALGGISEDKPSYDEDEKGGGRSDR